MKLTRANFRGPWAGLPVSWTKDNHIDEAAYRRNVEACALAGVPGIYTGGTSGEFYAQTFEEFVRVAEITVHTAHQHNMPAMVGCTDLSTRGVLRRIEQARLIGADAVQVALPFWMPVADHEVIPFFVETAAAAAAGNMAFSIYETRRAKRVLTLDEHRAIHAKSPNYLMVKSNEGTLGHSLEGCRDLSAFVNVFTSEDAWAKYGPVGVAGCCSSIVYWSPHILLPIWEQVEKKNWDAVNAGCARLTGLFAGLFKMFEARGFTDSAYDRMVGLSTGFLQGNVHGQGPYSSPTEDDRDKFRQWIQTNMPDFMFPGNQQAAHVTVKAPRKMNVAETTTISAIDVHGHYGNYSDLKSPLGDWFMSGDISEVARYARECGVEWTVVSPLLGLLPRFRASAVVGNEEASRLVPQTPGILQWVIINPLEPESYKQADAALKNPWCVGVKIHPEEHGYPIQKDGREIFRFCAERGAVILTHSGESRSMPPDFVPFANEFKDVKLILAHIGCSSDGDPSRQVRAIQASKHGNIYADTSSARSVMPRIIEWAVREAGVEKVLYGSDTPLYGPAMFRARIDAADLTAAEKKAILRDNAVKLLGLDKLKPETWLPQK